jgi:hypothetical protein
LGALHNAHPRAPTQSLILVLLSLRCPLEPYSAGYIASQLLTALCSGRALLLFSFARLHPQNEAGCIFCRPYLYRHGPRVGCRGRLRDRLVHLHLTCMSFSSLRELFSARLTPRGSRHHVRRTQSHITSSRRHIITVRKPLPSYNHAFVPRTRTWPQYPQQYPNPLAIVVVQLRAKIRRQRRLWVHEIRLSLTSC